ncbi:hypothetical protein ACQ4M3_13110 [Leptolyngbya sp. AN03gr2]|uniref:hypothetical protein n=1 Tax=unclassified Leptolyngbya TaxID=2650499 RepID=UPI003D314600
MFKCLRQTAQVIAATETAFQIFEIILGTTLEEMRETQRLRHAVEENRLESLINQEEQSHQFRPWLKTCLKGLSHPEQRAYWRTLSKPLPLRISEEIERNLDFPFFTVLSRLCGNRFYQMSSRFPVPEASTTLASIGTL